MAIGSLLYSAIVAVRKARLRLVIKNRDDGKIRRFIHSPFNGEHNDIEYAVDKDGRIKLTKSLPNDEFDEIEVSASLIFMLAEMLTATRKVKYVDKEDV